jgi:PAS domain S-box-containing protein
MSSAQDRAVRAIDIAISFVEREELRLRAVIESDKASADERFRALQDLAYLSEIVVRELADIHVGASADGSSTQSPEMRRARLNRIKPKTRRADRGAREASFYRDVCDNLSEGVYFVDKERKLTYWNRGAQKLAGYQREEVIGKHCYDNFLQHQDDCGRMLCHAGCPLAETLKDGKARHAEVALRHKDGHRVPVSVQVSPVVDRSGTLIGAVEVFSLAVTKALA